MGKGVVAQQGRTAPHARGPRKGGGGGGGGWPKLTGRVGNTETVRQAQPREWGLPRCARHVRGAFSGWRVLPGRFRAMPVVVVALDVARSEAESSRLFASRPGPRRVNIAHASRRKRAHGTGQAGAGLRRIPVQPDVAGRRGGGRRRTASGRTPVEEWVPWASLRAAAPADGAIQSGAPRAQNTPRTGPRRWARPDRAGATGRNAWQPLIPHGSLQRDGRETRCTLGVGKPPLIEHEVARDCVLGERLTALQLASRSRFHAGAVRRCRARSPASQHRECRRSVWAFAAHEAFIGARTPRRWR